MNLFNLIKTKGLAYVSILLLLTIVNTPTAWAQDSNTEKVTISLKKAKVSQAFDEITKQTKVKFFYSESAIKKVALIDLNEKNEALDRVLNQITKQTGLSFSRKGQTITVGKGTNSPTLHNQEKDRTKKITGLVLDELNEPIIGASIHAKVSNKASITDIDGKFVLEASEDEVVEISYLGYQTVMLNINQESDYVIRMKENNKLLDEVVVVGYGTQKKVNLTGAVGVVDGSVMENRPIGNIAQGLQGAIPNLNINFASGAPNSATTINVRGATSINGGDALILVDGVEVDDLSLLNPQDIESVSLLKDAASAAIYGARAAFGVLLVTTKTGKRNSQVKINYNNNFSWATPSRLPKDVSADKWIRAVNQANINNGEGQFFNDKQIAAIDGFIKDPLNNPSSFVDVNGDFTAQGEWAYAGNTKWFDEMYKSSSFMQQHNASVSGGSEKSSYYGSVGYKGQDGLLAYGSDDYKRINMAFNFSTNITKWLEITFRTKYNRNESNEPKANYHWGASPHYEVYRAFPYIPIRLADGQFAAIEGSNFNYNIAGILDEAGRDKLNSDDVWYTGAFNITPIKGLSIKGDYTGNKFFTHRRTHLKTLYQTMPDPSQAPLAKGLPNSVTHQRGNNTYEALNAWADYSFKVKDHSFQVMGGYNQESKHYANLYTVSSDLFINDYPVSGLASTNSEIKELDTIWAVQGAFFRFNYNYKSKYLLETNGRYDGSSRYRDGDRWGFFPSVSGGWRVTEETFMESTRNWLDDLKIRASYGSLGNQVTDGNFQYLGFLEGVAINNYSMGGKLLTGLTPPTLPSANITWEKVTTTNLGIDIVALQNRLSASFDYFVRKTSDMVVAKTYPSVLGTSGGKENLASMRTNGWELSVTWRDRIQNVAGSPLEYSFGVGLSDSRSKITKYDNPTGSLSEPFYKGRRIGEIWGYETDGFITTDEEAIKMSEAQGDISKVWLPGDIRYKDLDGDGKITSGENTIHNPGDKKVIGNSTPRYNFNINATASWKGFDLRALFEGTAKRDIWMNSEIFWGYKTGIWSAAVRDHHIDDSWSPENQNAYFPLPMWGDRSKQVQTKYLQNGAYIRLKDITLSYSIPQNILRKYGLEQLKVYVSGQNLWDASGLFKYLDPEIVGARNNKGETTSDGKVYPFTRTYSLGINLTF